MDEFGAALCLGVVGVYFKLNFLSSSYFKYGITLFFMFFVSQRGTENTVDTI